MPSEQLYIGLMSGTSADAIDAALVDLSDSATLIAHHSQKLTPELRQRIHKLCTPGDDEIDQMGMLDVELGQHFAQTTLQLLQKTNLAASDIVAIGSHGQTIRHRPPSSCSQAFTLQIGDPNTIAELTGITTVADFRRRDMAAAGQGAPLVPAFHRAIFQSHKADRAIVNIGGMANITWLPKDLSDAVIGFDTGPGNVLMDGWILAHCQQPYDQNGAWAASGTPIAALLDELLLHPFFAQQPPKSTGRESFNHTWLETTLEKLGKTFDPADIQATLLELTARSIAQCLNGMSDGYKEVYICGGGAYNSQLMLRLSALINNGELASTETLGIAPEWIEAMAFAWLAQQTLQHKPGNLRAVTGARRDVILGGVYIA